MRLKQELLSFYDKNISFWLDNPRDDVRDKYLSLLQLGTNIDLLDVGCGCGLDINKILQKQSINCTGIDFSSVAISIAKENNFNKNVVFDCKDFMLYKPSKEYDVVLFCMVIMHYSNLKDVFGKLSSFMKKEGQLLVVTNNPYVISAEYKKRYSSEKSFTYNHKFVFNNEIKYVKKFLHPFSVYLNHAAAKGLMLKNFKEIDSYRSDTKFFNPIKHPYPNFWVFVYEKR